MRGPSAPVLTALACWLLLAPAAARANPASPGPTDAPSAPESSVPASGHPAESAADAFSHSGGHDGEHVPGWGDVNWVYGLLGETDGTICGWLGFGRDHPPNVLCRPPGMGVPLVAMLLNTALLVFLFVFYGRRPLREALRRRRQGIVRAITEASQMRAEAAATLDAYREKLRHIDEEIQRLRQQMHTAGQAERARVLAEARQKHARMERDARVVIEQELNAAREELRIQVVRTAARSAADLLRSQVRPADQQRLSEHFLEQLRQSAQSGGGRS
jgi:F-type H+-transporting ATPase subunit b